jgi:transcriptional regulator with XRE-family HTH domain
MTGQQMRKIRKDLGLTQAELAALVGVATNSIARQERGEMGIRESLARLIQLTAQTGAKGSRIKKGC